MNMNWKSNYASFGQRSVGHQKITTVEAKLPVSFGSNNSICKLQDNAGILEIKNCMKEKRMMEMKEGHQNFKNNVSHILYLLFLFWTFNVLFSIGPKRILKYMKKIVYYTLNLVVIIICVQIILKLHLWYTLFLH